MKIMDYLNLKGNTKDYYTVIKLPLSLIKHHTMKTYQGVKV
jgi:hypothetical protein